MDLVTQPSLLHRLGGTAGETDWEVFYGKYAGVILSFAQKRGLDEFGARDVLQETMVLLMKKLPDFVYEPERGRFRNWLLTIVAHKVREAMRRSHRDRLVGMDEAGRGGNRALKDTLAAEDPGPAEALEAAWRSCLFEEALRRLEANPQTQPDTFAVFRDYCLENHPAAVVAHRFGIKENAVYQIKNRLMKRLRDEVAHLEVGTQADPEQ